MELIDNVKNALDSLLNYFTCHLRPTADDTYKVIDWTHQQWKYRKDGKSRCYINRIMENGKWSNDAFFYIRETTTELYRTEEYTLLACSWTKNYNRHCAYFVLDNSKLIKSGGDDL